MTKDYKVLKAKTKDYKALKANDRGLNIKFIIFTLSDIWCGINDEYYEKKYDHKSYRKRNKILQNDD